MCYLSKFSFWNAKIKMCARLLSRCICCFSRICVFAVCVFYMHICGCLPNAYTCRGFYCLPLPYFLILLSDRVSHWTRILTFWLVWLTSKFWNESLFHPSTEVTGLQSFLILCQCYKFDSAPHTWRENTLTHWIISPAPTLTFLTFSSYVHLGNGVLSC